MSKNFAIAGAVVVGVTAAASLGWKAFKGRKASKAAPVKAEPVKAEPVKAEVKPVEPTPAPAAKQEEVKPTVAETPAVVKLVEDGKILEPNDPFVKKLMEEIASFGGDGLEINIPRAEVKEEPQDVVTTVEGVDGPIASVSRVRVGTSEPVEADTVPVFWGSFYRKIRRDKVVELSPQDFATGNKPALAKGYHKGQIEGFAGPAIIHATNGHVSAVVYLGGTVFIGFSTSGSRFPRAASAEANIPGTFSIDAKQAKDFLNGR